MKALADYIPVDWKEFIFLTFLFCLIYIEGNTAVNGVF